MSAAPMFDVYGDEPDPERRSKWASCFMSCLMVLAVAAVLAIIAGVWISMHWRGWFARFGLEAINEVIDSSDLPPQEKLEVKAQAEHVAKAFGNGEISKDQAVALAEKLVHSPLIPSLIVMAKGKYYFDRSGLSDEEKAQGRESLRRFARGAIDGKIDQKGIDAVLAHVADRRGENNWHFRDQVSDTELRAAIVEAKSRADHAGVPAEVENTIDPSEEVKRIIDEALNKK